MKKYLLVLVSLLLVVTGCGKNSEKGVLKKITKKIESAKSYTLKGELEIINNEESYMYDVSVSYLKKDYYKVSLKNQVNNHEQIILRNDSGVYVLTPSLNKSFKFQSDWPYNNSQVYLYQTIINDLNKDKKKTFEIKDNQYIFTSTVNYSNNKNLVKQKVIANKKYEITEIQILNNNDMVQMKMKFNNKKMNANLNKKDFDLNENVASFEFDTEQRVSKITDILYPMYLPINTQLKTQNRVSSANGERVILTFTGDKEFLMTQEPVELSNEFTVQPVDGELVMLSSTLAVMNEGTITWVNNGIEHYIVSKKLTEDELISIANSIGNMPVSK